MAFIPKEVDVDRLIDEYTIDIESTERIRLSTLESSTHLFKVDRPDLIEDLYIIETLEGRTIACHPHIVGETLNRLAGKAALEVAKAMTNLTSLLEVDWDSIIVENVLRAAPGYALHPAFQHLYDKSFRDVWIRPRYKKPSYRDHDEEIDSELQIVYEDFTDLPQNKELVVLKPDTEATGKTGKKSIERLMVRCEEVGSSIREIILYGFISIPGLKLISELAKKQGIRLMIFAIGNISDLAFNGYDMTLYGLDESYWKETKKIRKLGSIIDRTTLKRYLPEFIPGADQPGDWSNRQTSIYVTKDEQMKGGIKEHLQNSIKLINDLSKISNYSLWQMEIVEKELRYLFSTLSEYRDAF